MRLINYSGEYEAKLFGWLPHDLHADSVVFFPDACPGRAPLPTGTAVLTRQENWRKFAVSDCGCGMLLAKSRVRAGDFREADWDALLQDLRRNKGRLGDLGSGNHFLDALQPYDEEAIHFLIHTGSREESTLVEPLVDQPERFDAVFSRVCAWAAENRGAIAHQLERYFGPLERILDRNHNSYETTSGGAVIIRKGAVKLFPGEETVIPSNMNGDVALVRAKEPISAVLNSMSHGTGRVMSRSEAKTHAEGYDYQALRKRIYIPPAISDESIKTEAPFCYRELDDCLNLVKDLVEEVRRFAPFAYLGQI